MAEDGQEEILIAQDPAFAVARLAKMKTPEGAPWLDAGELAAARRLALDAEAGARGGMRLSRWAGDHAGGAVGARGSNGAEAALAAGFEARRRVQRVLGQLAGPLRAVTQAVCLEGVALEALERRSAWPARSARVALKLALSQLAAAYRGL
jgi:DNA-directed RNA polymerase specialized sigma24 family protein